MFKSSKEKKDDAGDDDLRIRITDRFLVVTDVAGFFPGKEVTWPRVENEKSYPDLPTLVGRMLATAGSASSSSNHVGGALLALFRVASSVYDATVTIEPTSETQGALFISIGESFLGAIMRIRQSDESLAQMAEYRRAWDARLGQVDMGTGELDPIIPLPDLPDADEDFDAGADLELLILAAHLVVSMGRASPAMLQRKLRVGYVKAGHLMDLLERRGIVGPQDGSAARVVFLKPEQADSLAASIRAGGTEELNLEPSDPSGD